MDKLKTNSCGKYGLQDNISSEIDTNDRIKIFYDNDIIGMTSHIPNYFEFHVNNTVFLFSQ